MPGGLGGPAGGAGFSLHRLENQPAARATAKVAAIAAVCARA